MLTGERWLRQAEAFGVFFRAVAWLAPIGRRMPLAAADRLRRREITLTVPGLRLLAAEVPGWSGAAFLLLVLAAVSFDGLSRTFAWLALLGVNPLAYPGRTALVVPNTLGLLAMFLALGLAYGVAVGLSARLAAVRLPRRGLPGAFAPSLVPIACGYHFAHYLPTFLVDVQYALRAASDPLARGWDLLGTRDLPVVTSFLSDPARVYAIWHIQVAIIVLAHVIGVFIAHALAIRLAGSKGRAVRSQVPMLALMIGYTMLGLWLLSTPAVG
jgi:hypothetical protein